MEQQSKSQKAMDALSKKMGVAGIFLGWTFFVCTAPDKERVILGAIVTILFVVVTLWRQIIAIRANPKAVSVAQTVMGRMSSALAMAGGFLTGLFASNISMELKMWGGFSVVVAFLLMQGIYDTVKENLNNPEKLPRSVPGRLGGGAPPPELPVSEMPTGKLPRGKSNIPENHPVINS